MLDIDPDITRARTPPASLYTDPALFPLVRERVFQRGWSALVEVDGSGAHSIVPCTLGGTEALWTRDGDREHLLSNVCTHRASKLVDEPCAGSVVRCPYHGRRFRLDGVVTAAPGFDGDLTEAALPAWSLGTVGPLRFGAREPSVAFDDWWAPVHEVLASIGADPSQLRLDPAGSRTHVLDVPWLLYLENYLEGFHVPFVHPELAKTLVLDDYHHVLLPQGTLQVGVARPGEHAFHPTSGAFAGRAVGAFWFWLWPATLINVYPWGISLNVIEATAHGRCRVRYRAWVWAPALRTGGAGGALDLVERQDQEVVERAWAGLRHGAWARGRYSARQEVGLHHFHRLLAAALA
jgi:choline monooxygenase